MPKFAIMLNGSGCRVRLEDIEQGFDSSGIRTLGFFTTRWVDASSEGEARDEAISMVKAEVKGLLANTPGELWSVNISEVRENPSDFANRAPGRGFTWYPDEGQAEKPRATSPRSPTR